MSSYRQMSYQSKRFLDSCYSQVMYLEANLLEKIVVNHSYKARVANDLYMSDHG